MALVDWAVGRPLQRSYLIDFGSAAISVELRSLALSPEAVDLNQIITGMGGRCQNRWTPRDRFVDDSALEEGVSSEPVSEDKIPC